MQRVILILSLLLILVLFPVCEEKIFTGDVDCYDCFQIKPDSVDLIIHWTKNEDYPEIPVVLFRGKVDQGSLIDTFYRNEVPAYIWVDAEAEYSAKAIYESADRTVIVVDGTKQKLKHVSEYCDEPCWVITNADLYLELKF